VGWVLFFYFFGQNIGNGLCVCFLKTLSDERVMNNAVDSDPVSQEKAHISAQTSTSPFSFSLSLSLSLSHTHTHTQTN
jgi:hypothetical protein